MQKFEQYLASLAKVTGKLRYEQFVLGEDDHPRRMKEKVGMPPYAAKYEPIAYRYEVAYVVKGRCIISLANKPYLLSAGDICFVKIGEEHFESYYRENEGYEIIWFMYSPASKLKACYVRYDQAGFFHVLSSVTIRVPKTSVFTLDEIMLSLDPKNNFPAVKEKITRWFGIMKESIEKKSSKLNPVDVKILKDIELKAIRIEKSIKYITKNYNKLMTLKEIAAQAGLTQSYFCFVFRKVHSISLFEYIVDLRVKAACDLLRTTDLRIKQISFEVGYNDQYFFSRIFTRYIGMSPRDYRKKILIFSSRASQMPPEKREATAGFALNNSTGKKL